METGAAFIFMTEEGKEKQRLVDQAFTNIEKKALMDISGEEYEQFLSVYRKIYANLQERMDHE